MEKYPQLFLPRTFLWWHIPEYLYNWGYSRAYIELLCTDTVIMDFGEGKKKMTIKDYDKTMEVWKKKQSEGDIYKGAWGTVKNKK